ncbi:PREDICTED: embryonic polarity protein dorsal-like [Ceratosolen solmsi marchali]|uniref:Embryonic polarity protein dorsal-like n=1 Tax=Ceratosolen solmsi marchali TaxID=326594 RepID=A0AAJ6YEJ1_9HYME|nr:PREDICTED: embryonic polarity protein dorsal-like [Ceratosolen solmsi marchali]
MNTTWMNNVAVPQVKIIEQPSSKGTRFRYECEGRFSNNILGASGKKSFPTIRIINYNGPLSIIVSCVTKDLPYRPHPHKLVNGNDIQEHGICLFRIPENNKHDISFRHLSVQCTAKRNIIKSLAERERVQIDPFKSKCIIIL